jgi:prolyl 4-hydroxylase
MNVLDPLGPPLPDELGRSMRLPFVRVVDGFLDDASCAAFVARIDVDAAPAPVTTARGPVMRPDLRNNERVMFDDVDAAAALFARMAPFVPAELRGEPRTTQTQGPTWRAVGLNERFRGYRYRPGQRFAPHFDGCFARSETEQSAITVLLYLNDGCGGGATRLLDYGVTVAPKRGMLFLFDHYLLHEGAEVTAGEKHVLRSDVMYQRIR